LDKLNAVLQTYAASNPDCTTYLAETATYYLVANSANINPVVNGKLTTVANSTDPIISQSASYLSTFSTFWRNDGVYTLAVDGVLQEAGMISYTDATETIDWKLITVCPYVSGVDDWVSPPAVQLSAVTDQLTSLFSFTLSMTKAMAHLHDGDSYAPLANPPMLKDPTQTGSTQQALWGIAKAFLRDFPGSLVTLFINTPIPHTHTLLLPTLNNTLTIINRSLNDIICSICI
jgi:hypothetical protein